MLTTPKKLKMGGQAVIEGVMMRAEDNWAVAVRTPRGEIVVKKEPWRSIGKKYRILDLPVLRGAILLVETLVLGVKALSFSAEASAEQQLSKENDSGERENSAGSEEKGFWWSLSLAGTVFFSLVFGLALFFYLPLFVTEMLALSSPFWFNVVDGMLRIAVFLAYLLIISRWKEIARVFEYHGAEHQTIAAFEARKELIWGNIRRYSRFHPRCGTSFVLVLLVLSIFVFMFFGKPADWGERFLRMLTIPLIGGISYELIKLSDRYPDNVIARIAAAPGLWLQKITTRPPDERQVEVAVAALKSALDLDSFPLEEPLAVPARDG